MTLKSDDIFVYQPVYFNWFLWSFSLLLRPDSLNCIADSSNQILSNCVTLSSIFLLQITSQSKFEFDYI